MDVTNMPPKIQTLLTRLATDYPQIQFQPDEVFRWSPTAQTVYYRPATPFNVPELLHELSHAILGHASYTQDIELIQIEREAWTHAQLKLAPLYDASIEEETIEEALETYREWLHGRSLCPGCNSNGLHTKTDTYKCLACGCQWRANDARICELRRFKL